MPEIAWTGIADLRLVVESLLVLVLGDSAGLCAVAPASASMRKRPPAAGAVGALPPRKRGTLPGQGLRAQLPRDPAPLGMTERTVERPPLSAVGATTRTPNGAEVPRATSARSGA
jgi:hypothetical protein